MTAETDELFRLDETLARIATDLRVAVDQVRAAQELLDAGNTVRRQLLLPGERQLEFPAPGVRMGTGATIRTPGAAAKQAKWVTS